MLQSKMIATFFGMLAVALAFVAVRSSAQTAVGGNLLVNNPALDTVVATFHTQEETSIAVNPTTGTICVLYNDTYGFEQGPSGIGVSRSTNGGASFNDLGGLGPIPGGGDEAASDPSVVFRQSDGKFYATAITGGLSVGLWASTDDCSSFGFVTMVDVQGSLAPGDDKDMMTVDNNPTSTHYGRLYVAFLDHAVSPNPATEKRQVLSLSDNATTWSTPLILSGAGLESRGSWPTVAPNGDLYIAWDVLGTSSTFDIDVVRSVNGGASFSAVANPVTGAITPYNAAATATCSALPGLEHTPALNGGIRYTPFPQIAVGPDGCIHLSYSIGPNTSHTGDTVDVYYRRSCTNGASWEPAVKINDDGTATDQFLPNLSVSAANVVSVAFYDRRNDPTNNLAYDMYMRESVDGGTTFKPSVRVTSSSNPTFVEPLVGDCTFADYDQQAQVPGAIYLLWTDNRAAFNGNPDTNVGFQKMNPGNGVCGSAVASPCNVTVNTLSGSFSSVQSAVNAAPNGSVITVTGRCTEHVSVIGRSGLTIQGIPPAGGCGASGPAPGDLSSTISGGMDVVLSALNIQVKYLNLVDSSTSGLNVDTSVVSAGTCNCMARNAAQGLRISGVGLSNVTQSLMQNNPRGVLVQASNTVLLDHDTVVNNTGDGIFTLGVTASVFTSNNVQGNTGRGVVLTTSTGDFVNGNTITGNGDGLVNLVNCVLSAGNLGNNIPLLCL